jgi:uncharacterized protein YkwD
VITTDGTPPTANPSPTQTTPPGDPAPSPTSPTPTVPPTSPTASPATVPPSPTTPAPSPTTPRPTTPAPSPTTPRPTTPAPDPDPTGNPAFEAEVLRLVNVERATAGCNALTSDDRLVRAARKHSADMAERGYFSHTTPEGVDFATRISNEGYRWGGAAENIAKGQRTPADVMSSWMNSAGHKANILNCGYRNLGVGVAAEKGGALVWTQDFASPL